MQDAWQRLDVVAMRLLPVGPDHGGDRRCWPRSRSRPTPTSTAHGRQHLPLRHLSAHPRRRSTRPPRRWRPEPCDARIDDSDCAATSPPQFLIGAAAPAPASHRPAGFAAGAAGGCATTARPRRAQSTRTPSSRSRRTTRSPCSRQAHRVAARASTPGSRRSSPRSSTPTGPRCASRGAGRRQALRQSRLGRRLPGHRRLDGDRQLVGAATPGRRHRARDAGRGGGRGMGRAGRPRSPSNAASLATPSGK